MGIEFRAKKIKSNLRIEGKKGIATTICYDRIICYHKKTLGKYNIIVILLRGTMLLK